MHSHQPIPAVAVGQVDHEAYLLDVREPDEWNAGHAPDAHHVPMMELPGRIGELPQDRDVVVVCRVGNRSARVVAYLQSRGLRRCLNLDGGMMAWQAAGRPMVSDDGQPARVL